MLLRLWYGLIRPSSIHVNMLIGLILLKSYATNHCCYETVSVIRKIVVEKKCQERSSRQKHHSPESRGSVTGRQENLQMMLNVLQGQK